MLVDIDRVIVGDRIRKDFGDIEELAEDIKENGLINPPVINKDYVLLAGERRLMACKSLGWNQIEVRMMDTRDAEHELNIEISENDVRKGFSKSERLDYIKRLYRIEQAKATERHAANGGDHGNQYTGGKVAEVENSPQPPDKAKTRDVVADAFGISSNTMRRELYIDEHKELLDPADFADWDEGKLSTNKAFQKIKAAKAQAERELRVAEQERDAARRDLAEAYKDSDSLEAENASLRRQVAEKPKPEVVEREVVREVPPADYDSLTRRTKSLEHDNQVYIETNQELRRQNEQMRRELDKAKDLLGMDETMQEIRRDVKYLTSATVGYVRRYGGLTWTAQEFGEVDEASLVELRNAVRNLATFSSTLMDRLDCEYGKRHSS